MTGADWTPERAEDAVRDALALVRAMAGDDQDAKNAVLDNLSEPVTTAAFLAIWVSNGVRPAELDVWQRAAGL
jgi:hypothetical protein